MLVRVKLEQIPEILKLIGGQLTVTIRGDPATEKQQVLELVETGKKVSGRTIVNGVPTGVDVNDGIQHGGPYPATSDGCFSSVGFGREQWGRFIARTVSVQGLQEFLAKTNVS